MKKRIIAWLLLFGFVLLLLNIIVFRVYWQMSVFVYLIVVFGFMFYQGRLKHSQADYFIPIKGDDEDKDADNSDNGKNGSEGSSGDGEDGKKEDNG